MTRLAAAAWGELSRRHAARADELTAGHRARKRAGERDAIEDFLFEYYNTRPALLRRWHPGIGVVLEASDGGRPAAHAAWRWYRADDDGAVTLDAAAFLADRKETVVFVHRLLRAIASRPVFTGCFGLHEWAMVYREAAHRHALPLRLGQAGTDAVVERSTIRCTHFDAFRFFTEDAIGLNRVRPTRGTQVQLEQPGCLHAAMDCHKWALKLGPAVPGELALDCFELARDVRLLDMQASPYDLSSYGQPAVRIETAEGKAVYVARQRGLAERAAGLRAGLIEVCERLLAVDRPGAAASSPGRTVGV